MKIMTDYTIEVENLSKKFGHKTILNNVNIYVANEIFQG